MSELLSPDAVCAVFSDQQGKITLRMLEDDTVLIEGDGKALEFLGHLLLAQAQFSKDCGFQISPGGAGNALFSPQSTHGLYIHRAP